MTSPWPPAGAIPPVAWEEGERARWEGIVSAVRSSGLYRRLCAGRLAGTELPLLGFRGGRASEDRADLVVSFAGPGGRTGEFWIVDYKTGPRERELEEEYLLKMREYRGILAGAWKAPVRGFIWYLETGESPEVS